MRKLSLLLFITALYLCGFSSNQKKILVLNSYHNGLSWTDSIVTCIKQELLPNPSFSIYIEYMDSKRHYEPEYLSLLKNFYLKKYANHPFDLIISTDNNAYDFLRQYRNELFGKVPVLFCGLNFIQSLPKGYSGVFENLNFCKNLDLIKKHHPDFSEIVIVTDHSTTGEAMIDLLQEDIAHMKTIPKYRILQANSISGLQTELSLLSPKDIVLYLVFNCDLEGNYYTYEKGFEKVKPYCKVPVYSIWDFYLGKGVVGGALITGRNQGSQVVEMAKKLLSGVAVDELPPVKARYEYVFDYKQLQKFDIDSDQLPKNSKIINVPYNFIQTNKEITFLTLTILVLLIVTIVVMIVNTQLRKVKAQKEQVYLLEIKKSNKQLEKAKLNAEESNRLKSAFLANMSHEIRTPMNAILGFTELLSEDDVSKESKTKFISIIQKNTKSLLRLINDILDISKIETNQLKISKCRCKFTELFENLQSNYNTLCEQYGNSLDLKISVPENSSITEVHTDPIRLEQVFTNLLQNAVKFTQKGFIEIGYKIQGKQLCFFVKDTGIGIPDDKQKIIFDRFRQAELDANVRQYGGTGLGLAISKSLVELLGGQIWIESKINKGTTFYFTIPI